MTRKWLVALAVVAAATFGFWQYQQSRAVDAARPPASVAVTRGTVELSVLAAGVIEASSLVSVGAQVSGRVETLAVALGDRVKQGDLIAELESLDQQNAVLQAKADLAQIDAQIAANRATLNAAQKALDRTAKLSAQALAPTDALETAESALAVAAADALALAAQRERTVIAVSTAALDLERTRITAPMDGTVVAVVNEQGQSVNAAQSSPTIVKMANLDRMVVTAEISEADVIRVRPGQSATLTLLGEPDTRIDATLRSIAPAPASIKTDDKVDTTKAIYYNGLLDVENPGGKLRIGMTAEVTIMLARAEDVLTLPSTVITRTDQGQAQVEIWDAATETRAMRDVTVGLDNSVTAEITAGLAEGDRVVSDRATGTSAAVAMRGRRGMLGF
jgi:macrolide-specific efflux system membrane fusion protein